MKKLGLGILIAILALTLSGVIVIAKAITPQEKGKANAPDLEKIEFIHYKKNFAKPEAAKAPKPPSCYKFLTPGKNPIRWYDTVNYVINPNNSQGLSKTLISSAVSTSAETWNVATTSKELMNDTYAINYTAVYGVQNYENALVFGDYPTAGVIAVTTVWYNPASRAIVEFDIMFDTDWTWGKVSEATPNVMDLQNIATHEFGHGVGLADVYGSVCSAVTMYGYSDYGETQKRDLADPDIKGLQTLYP